MSTKRKIQEISTETISTPTAASATTTEDEAEATVATTGFLLHQKPFQNRAGPDFDHLRDDKSVTVSTSKMSETDFDSTSRGADQASSVLKGKNGGNRCRIFSAAKLRGDVLAFVALEILALATEGDTIDWQFYWRDVSYCWASQKYASW